MSGRSRGTPAPGNLGGRPLTIDDATLLNHRDCWVAFLSDAWGDIGWRLARARSPADIRETFAAVANVSAQEQVLLKPFVRETTIRVTAPEIRRTRAALKALREREHEYSYSGNQLKKQVLTDRVGDSKEALRVAWATQHKERSRLREEHVRRATELAAFKKELHGIERQRVTLEATLAEQEASFAQSELGAFIRARKYAHSPRNLAHAMAGPPHLGSWQSFRRCGEHPESPIWPTLRFQMFKIIEKAWRARTNRSTEAFLLRVQKGVRVIRTTLRDGKPDHGAAALQRYFLENWRYLKQAIEAANIGDAIPASVPYLVLGVFVKRVAQRTSTTDRVLASMEQFDVPRPARQKRKHR